MIFQHRRRRGTAFALLVAAASLLGPTVALASTDASAGASRAAAFDVSAPTVTASATPTQVNAYVQKVFHDLVGRAPDPAGLAYWTTTLNSGVPRGAVAWALATSDEYRSDVISSMYQQYLGRGTDAGGLAYWVSQIGAGLTFEQFQLLLLSSDEYFQSPTKGKGNAAKFVDAMYHDVLGRAVDATGESYFLGLLNGGTSRGQIVGALVYSTEHLQSIVNGYYQHFLGRNADAAGLGYWSALLGAGQRDESIVALIIASDEYFFSAPVSPPPTSTTTTTTTTTSPSTTTTTTTATTTSTTTTTTTTAPVVLPTVSLVSSFVSGSNVTVTAGAANGALDVVVDEPATGSAKLAEGAPGANGRVVLTVPRLANGAHTLRIRSFNVGPGHVGGTASNPVTLQVTINAPVRSTVDQPDDLSGDQVHIMYVVPSDGTDNHLDINGAITNSVAAWNGWLTAQMGGAHYRIDTFHGVPDITFVRLNETNAAVANTGDDRTEIEADLHTLGFNKPGKIYAVYYDGSGTFCGGGAFPPGLVGNVAAVYLQGSDPRVTPPALCNTSAVGADPTNPGYFDYGIVHEVTHTLGFVAACAPHISVEAHVGDSNHDLMYSPRDSNGLPWTFPAVLDFNHDDYYKHNIPGCLDLSRSAFIDPLPASSQAPPGWAAGAAGTANALSVVPNVTVAPGRSAPLPPAPR